MKRRMQIGLAVLALLLAAVGAAGAQSEVDWEGFDAGWVYIDILASSDDGTAEFRDAYRILPDFDARGVVIIYYEQDLRFTLTAEDAYLLQQALSYFAGVQEGQQRQMNGREWKGFSYFRNGLVLAQIELVADQGGESHVMLIPIAQVDAVAKAIEAALLAL